MRPKATCASITRTAPTQTDTHDEPSLGFLEITKQEGIAQGGTDQWFIDRELDTSDAEPSLGSLDHQHSQEHWAVGGRRDFEEDLAESGIADLDGLLEQIGSPELHGCERRGGLMRLIRLLFTLYRLRFTRWWWQAKRFLTSSG